MSECGCYHGLDCTKISVCSHETAIEELEAQLSAAHTLIHQIEDEIKYTGSEIHVRKSINNYTAAIGEVKS